MLISERFQRFAARRDKIERLNSASQSDLQNVKSLRLAPNDRSALAQRARTESKRLYAKASKDAGPTFQDSYESRVGALEFVRKYQK